ncbi:MAG: serine/threonine protein kinase [Gammaproteobacteria bacterium]|nr:serine/threonine protein kinase [Gammaproteobacteria bacterium]
MDTDRWQRIKNIYQQALDVETAERRAFVDQACDGDADLVAEIIALLEVPTRSASSIDNIIGAASAALGGELGNGERIGPYRLHSIIGQGGMGHVYLAERADKEFEQRVAIKMVNWAGASPSMIERFRLERQILANLEHPNIARMLDGGRTPNGVPYLVMEYVDGVSILDYAQTQKLSTKGRLQVFLQICDAVQYAHRKLVVHRDIKPSNVLVARDGVPKLLDFGIAKLLDGDSDAALTRADARVLTPEYASPEQLLGAAVTTATDIYGLGLMLYQLLAETAPFDFSSRTSPEIREIICHTEPAAPSEAALAGGKRDIAVKLSGDLDNIVLKTLRKEPDRRYETVKDFADDLRNYLSDRPVTARGESRLYRAGKFLRRNRATAFATALLMVAVASQTVFYTQRLAAERDRAQLQAGRAQEVADFLTGLFAEADPAHNLGEAMTARQMLDRGAARITQELDGQPDLLATLMVTIAQSYENMEENVAARDYLEASLPGVEARLGKTNADVLHLRFLLGVVMTYTGQAERARPIHTENLARVLGKYGADSYEAAREIKQLAVIQNTLGNYDAAQARFLEALDLFRDLGDSSANDLASTLLDYGSMLRRLDRSDEEEPMLLEALAIQAHRVGKMHPDYAAVLNNLGNHYFRRGNYAQARRFMEENVELQRRLNGDDAVPYGVALVNYASLIRHEGDADEAVELFLAALPIYATGYGTDAPRYAYLLENVANTMTDLGRYEEAETAYAESLAILGERFGTDHPEYAFTQRNRGIALGRMGWPEKAVPELRAAIKIWTASHGANYSRVVKARISLAENLLKSADVDAAVAEATTALEGAREIFPVNHKQRLLAARVAANAHRERQEFAAADALYRQSLTIASHLAKNSVLETALTEIEYAHSLSAQGRRAEARQLLEQRAAELATLDAADEDIESKVSAALSTL